MMIRPFQTLFAVPMKCQDCVEEVSKSLHELPGISKVDANLKEQLVSVEGIAAPSEIVKAIQTTGRDAILRGSGESNSAAVAILETHCPGVKDPVRGLARMVQVSSRLTIIDLTVRGLPPGHYTATVRTAGDISRGATSTGGVWGYSEDNKNVTPRGLFGNIEVGKSGIGSVLLDKPIEIWEMLGRAMVVSKQQEGQFSSNAEDTIVGVIARSAGVWENEKTVCSCSGKTIWEERTENVGRGMI